MHPLPQSFRAALALVAVMATTALLRVTGLHAATTVALAYLLLVLFVASLTRLPVALVTSVVSALALNFFFLPPVGTFTIADPQNWVALGAFVVVSVVASNLSATARARAREAVDRRNEVTRLFDVSRDILLTSEGGDALVAVARHVARRFELPVVAVAMPSDGGWRVIDGGTETATVPAASWQNAWQTASGALEFDARSRTYGGRSDIELAGGPGALIPVRVGLRPVAVLAVGGRPLEPGTADAIAGLLAIAIERARFLDDRHAAELARQRADLSSALLASLGHDLRTPLTAVRVAITNAVDSRHDAKVRHEQATLAIAEVDRLTRLVQEILDMARIEARAVTPRPQWVTAGAIIEAAAAHVSHALDQHRLVIDAPADSEILVDPWITSAALGHVLENAARYSPPGTEIVIDGQMDGEGLRLTVTDQGPGFADDDLDRLFDPFVRGRASRLVSVGTGLGLAITRGMLAAERGRIWAERPSQGGARFVLTVPGDQRGTAPEEAWT